MKLRAFAVTLVLGWISIAAWAADSTPVGLWRTIDDNTGKDRSLVRIAEVNGALEGKVEKRLTKMPDDDPDGLCRKCPGTRKDQPVVGMTILWGLKPDGDSVWAGGEILDPGNGKTYRCKMKLIEGGKKLEVRGFIGVSILGRTQVWVREQ